MTSLNLRKQASNLVLAIAIATGSAVAIGALMPAEAHAQRKKKDKKEESSGKPQYSKEFIEAYQPVNEAINAEGADAAALLPQVRSVIPLAQSPDERLAGGGLVYNAGIKSGDRSVQLEEWS